MARIKHEKESKTPNRSIFRSLIISMIVFSILITVLLFGGMIVIQLLYFSEEYNDNFPYNITTVESVQEQLPSIENIGGWIEKLNPQYQVEKVYGIKKTTDESYTDSRLLSLTNNNSESQETFQGFLVPCSDQVGYYLIHINRDNMKTSHVIKLDRSLAPGQSNVRMGGICILIVFYILICFGVGYHLSRKIKKPLTKITEGIEQIKKGEENVKLDFYAENEFAQIRDAFNMMSWSIQQSKREREETERKKERMILDLSHDIRTPISTINCCALALKEHLVEEKDRDRYYDIIHQKACRVSMLSEDMFTMLKMKSNEYKLNKTKADICEFLREQCVYFYLDAQENQQEIAAEIPDETIMYEADYKLLARAVGNLFLNAIKYNKSGHQIIVKLEMYRGGNLKKQSRETEYSCETVQDSRIEIKVCDDGAQIEKNLRLELFHDFVRGDLTRHTTGGTGLGLPIAKAIIEKHDGTIGYIYENEWNCFKIVLNINMLYTGTDN